MSFGGRVDLNPDWCIPVSALHAILREYGWDPNKIVASGYLAAQRQFWFHLAGEYTRECVLVSDKKALNYYNGKPQMSSSAPATRYNDRGCTGYTMCGGAIRRHLDTGGWGDEPTPDEALAATIAREETYALSSLREKGEGAKVLDEISDAFEAVRTTVGKIKDAELKAEGYRQSVELQLDAIRGTVAFYLNEPLPWYRRVWRKITRK